MRKYQVSWSHKPLVITLCVYSNADLHSDLKQTTPSNYSILLCSIFLWKMKLLLFFV